MSTPACNNVDLLLNNEQLANDCACQSSSANLTKLLADYNNSVQTWKTTRDNYDNTSAQYAAWQGWNGPYQHYKDTFNNLKGQSQQMKNCPPWTTDYNRLNAYCHDDYGNNWQYTNGSNGGNGCAPGFGRGNCQLTDDYIKGQVNYPGPPNVTSPPGNMPQAPTANVTCCSQLFQGISAADVTFSNISQQCSTNIQSSIDKTMNTINAAAAAEQAAQDAIIAKKATTLKYENIGAVSGVLCVFFCIIIGIIMSEDEG